MTILTDDDKQTVKRTVPKPANKIHAGAVAKLYVAYPDRSRWTYTGLQGAAVLANDLVGNTWWIKLVDISSAGRGVLWDQEIYKDFHYNQDRTFFHTFELEDCLAGLSFADEKEAKQFKKKVDEREKNSHKNTKAKQFSGGGGGGAQVQSSSGGKSHGLSGLFSRHKHQAPQGPAQSIIPPRGVEIVAHNGANSPAAASPRPSIASDIDMNDPQVQEVLRELEGLGITADQIEEHKGFIQSYLAQYKATAAADAEKSQRAARLPPPPPPGNLSPQNTGSSKGGRGPPPAPPPSRRSAGVVAVQRPPSPSPSPPREPSPPRPRFRAPPPIADAGRFAHETAPPALPGRDRASSQSHPGPPPPPRPAQALHEAEPATRFGVPPPFEGKRISSGPPPPPARGGVPPPPPPRQAAVPVPGGFSSGPPPPPPLPPASSRPIPPPPGGAAPPPAPPLPPPSGSGPPPPPPLPSTSGGGPPLPPPMPPRGAGGAAPALPKVSAPGRDGLLADIRGGARLKKVADSEKRDRSGAMVPGSEAAAPAPPSGGGSAAAQGGLAGALASALAVRKSKVSHSDDEDDDDAW